MDNNNETITITSTDDNPLLMSELPNGVLQKIYDLYAKARSYETYMKLVSMVVLGGGVLIHNVFIAGKSYPIDQYDSIMHTEFTIIGLVIAAILVMWYLSAGDDREARETLEKAARQNNINIVELKEEVNELLITQCGGTGLK